MHFNVGSAMLAGFAAIVVVWLLVMVIIASKKPSPKPLTPASAARAVRIARKSRDFGRQTMFVSYEDDWPHPIGTSSARNDRHPSGYLVRQDGDVVTIAEVLKNEALSSVATTRFIIYNT
jgi:hypothetical protein